MMRSMARQIGIGVAVMAAAGLAISLGLSGAATEEATLRTLNAELQGAAVDYDQVRAAAPRSQLGIHSLTVTTSTAGVVLQQEAEAIPDPPAGKIALRLNFRYSPDPLPGEGITVWTPKEEAAQLWNMASLSEGEPVPKDESIPERTVFLTPGGAGQLVMLVVENPTEKRLQWLALPHLEDPSETSPQIWLTCFCLNFMYAAPPEGSWYRVIRVRAGPDLEPGTKVDTTWTVLTDPSQF